MRSEARYVRTLARARWRSRPALQGPLGSNLRAELWLRSLGYFPVAEEELDWIEVGQRPDFFCPGARPLLVEVKTFDPPAEQQLMNRAFNDLRHRCSQQDGITGDLFVCVGDVYDQLASRWLVNEIRSRQSATKCVVVLAVPTDVLDYSRTVRFEYESTDGRVLQSSPTSDSGTYPFYPGYEPSHWGSRATLVTDSSRHEGPELYDLLESPDALISAALYPSDSPLTAHTCVVPAMTGNRTDVRIRKAIKYANSQLRNAQSRRPAPGLCIIYHETLDFAGDDQVAAAAFGDLQIPVGGTMADAVYGAGGAWTERKNRGVSAIRYVRTDTSITNVINPWAEFPLDPQLFLERPWSMRERRPVRL